MKAWLVTWEWAGEYARVEEPIAAILNSRLSPERVRELVELLYVNASYCPSERLGYANRKRFNPYPARFGTLEGAPWTGQIICGHHPYLFARVVMNLRVERDAQEGETLRWDELPRPDLAAWKERERQSRQARSWIALSNL